MAFVQVKENARKLRRHGGSISEIATTLAASKSTVSYWCRDIVLSKVQQEKLADKQRDRGLLGRLRAAEQKRAQRTVRVQEEQDKGERDVGPLSLRDIHMLGLALYWGEGYKSGNEECGLTNSDPAIIRAFIEWLRRIFNVKNADLILRVSINATHGHRLAAVEKYWAHITGIPLSQFTATSLIKTRSKKVYSNVEDHFGTLRVKVRRGTNLRRRIMGSIHVLRKKFQAQ